MLHINDALHTALKEWPALLFFLLISQAAGLVGSVFTAPSLSSWYASLALPALSPPGWVFGPVWTLLYVLMGVAAFTVWHLRRRDGASLALVLFFVQLVLNALWSVLFFGMQSVTLALFEIGLLWLAIAATLAAFVRVSKIAAWLLVPYLLWVSFASYLMVEIWRLNG